MSAGPGHSSLRGRIAEALAEVLRQVSHEELGRLVGVAGTTVSRRAEDPRAWGFDLLELAIHRPALTDAVVAYLRGEARPEGQGVLAITALIAQLQHAGKQVEAISAALGDGRVDPTEARQMIDLIHARRHEEDRDLIPALEACLTLPKRSK